MTEPDPPNTVDTPIAAALRSAINSESAENGSNTPDGILGRYLARCLDALDDAIGRRDRWYGIDLAPGRLDSGPRDAVAAVLAAANGRPASDNQAAWVMDALWRRGYRLIPLSAGYAPLPEETAPPVKVGDIVVYDRQPPQAHERAVWTDRRTQEAVVVGVTEEAVTCLPLNRGERVEVREWWSADRYAVRVVRRATYEPVGDRA